MLLLAVLGLAATAPPASPADPPSGSALRATDGLEAEPIPFEVLGVRFRPPAGSVMRSEGAGRSATWIFSEDSETPSYILRLSKVYSDQPSSPAAQIDEFVRSVSERPSANAVFAVRERKEFSQGDRPAGLLYTSLREGEGAEEVSAVQGYFILQVAPAEFAVISSLVADADFPRVEPLLARTCRTLEALDAGRVAADRAERMERGDRLLKALDPSALRRALDPVPAGASAPSPRWYRISRNGEDGKAQEVGYMTVVALEAVQGAANPDRKESDWSPREREAGMLVRVQMRTLLDPAGKAVSDSDARYWVRWDRAREFWTVRTTARSGKATRTSAQLGIREPASPGSPRPVLEVTNVEPSKASAEPLEWPVPPVGYLSQAEAMVLPRLLPGSGEAARFGFYWFDTRSGRLAQRVDERVPAADGATVLSRRTLESPQTRDEVDRGGVLRTRSADAVIVEATTAQAMLDLWKRKGLPVE